MSAGIEIETAVVPHGAGQEIDRQIEPDAGVEQILDLLVRLAPTQLGVDLDQRQIRDRDAQPSAELADHDLGDQRLRPLAGAGELDDVRPRVVGFHQPGQRPAFAQRGQVRRRRDHREHAATLRARVVPNPRPSLPSASRSTPGPPASGGSTRLRRVPHGPAGSAATPRLSAATPPDPPRLRPDPPRLRPDPPDSTGSARLDRIRPTRPGSARLDRIRPTRPGPTPTEEGESTQRGERPGGGCLGPDPVRRVSARPVPKPVSPLDLSYGLVLVLYAGHGSVDWLPAAQWGVRAGLTRFGAPRNLDPRCAPGLRPRAPPWSKTPNQERRE